MSAREIISLFFFIPGLSVMVIGIVAMFRRDFFVNITLSSLLDSFGFLCFGIGLLILLGFKMVSLKLLILILLFLFLNPLASHTLANAASTEQQKAQKEEMP